ncbi:MAG: helix-turn-helix domain-containing protein [Lactobacillus delbrueckii]|jgi:putative transposase|nr:helix-turn-helix domain-containing protein [Lactobacillus delbrueckii]MCI1659508.1 helix-turn-helix domain-containing protein [Lactobacillus delbrueckii]MCI1707512.1 helix-turn-helix domain-containing protein [Lactobacillus delbrueckii]MCI1790483.1 helix-turn-helix domain-containing protein [Lactobacillus delbrueckii]
MAEQVKEAPAELIQTRVYELRPNKTMRKVLDEACDYRRYCWNQGLALWNEMYKARQTLKSSLSTDSKKLTEEQKVLLKDKPSPSERRVRNMLVADKKDWQYTQSARILQLAISDLGKAWNNFFDKAQPGWGKPKPCGLAVPEDWREPFHEVARVVLRYLRWSMRLPPCRDVGIPVMTAIRKMSVFMSLDIRSQRLRFGYIAHVFLQQ